jgi:hypothetical protein
MMWTTSLYRDFVPSVPDLISNIKLVLPVGDFDSSHFRSHQILEPSPWKWAVTDANEYSPCLATFSIPMWFSEVRGICFFAAHFASPSGGWAVARSSIGMDNPEGKLSRVFWRSIAPSSGKLPVLRFSAQAAAV